MCFIRLCMIGMVGLMLFFITWGFFCWMMIRFLLLGSMFGVGCRRLI